VVEMSLTLLQKSKDLLDEVVELFRIRFHHSLGTEFPPTLFVRSLFGELHVIMLVLGGSFHSTLAHPALLRKMRGEPERRIVPMCSPRQLRQLDSIRLTRGENRFIGTLRDSRGGCPSVDLSYCSKTLIALGSLACSILQARARSPSGVS
jgi:hypothetical protein